LGGCLNTPPAPHSWRHESSVTATVRDLPPTSAIEKTAEFISSTWPKSARLAGSSRPAAPSESSRFWPSKIVLRRNRQNYHRREADVEVSTAHPGASRTETIRRIGGLLNSARWEQEAYCSRRKSGPTTSGQNPPNATCLKIDSDPSGAVGLLLPAKIYQNRLQPKSTRARGEQ